MSKVWPLTPEQRPAVDPGEVVWLSASAGTGKTQVLSARVLRLLLQPDVRPSQILCLTFTKAGATEMAARINEVLARWVRASDTALASDLLAIGADHGPDSLARARTLFAEVLDSPGGGLRIDTIHAFAQWLLAAFPHEAGLLPGVKAMEDRDRALLLREVLADLLLEAERSNDAATLDALAQLSIRLGPDEVERYLLRCADAREAWTGSGAWQPPMGPRLRQLIGLPDDADASTLPALCSAPAFDDEALRLCLSAYTRWNVKTGQTGRVIIADWLSESPDKRLETLPDLHTVLFTKSDTVRSLSSLVKFESHFGEAAERVLACTLAVRERQALLALAGWLTPTLELGRKFALAWDDAKARAGYIDFDDQIRQASDLLTRSDLADWIRYKLDRRFDHILVDEAQDTNAAQWRIINELVGEFFSGEGNNTDKLRTLFVVGDYKQAIFRFQGTSPENFEKARQGVRLAMEGLADNARGQCDGAALRQLQQLGLGTSFRTAQSVLGFVDLAIERIGYDAFGLKEPPQLHKGEDRPGQVTIWRVVGGENSDSDSGADAAGEDGDDDWLAKSDRQLADRIARQIRIWMDRGFPLVKGGARRATPGDIMVLVRKRKELAGLIVGRLHTAGVPVAGVDRLRLAAPLGVRDLMAALRFAVQPFDDLTLASLLVSPLLGWDQQMLLDHGYRDKGVSLWDHLRRNRGGSAEAAVGRLLDLLRIADYEPPLALLHWVLTGPWQGRRNLVARLGREVNDPIDELLNAASAYAASETASLTGFIRWFDAGDGELKREAGKAGDQVRVMTVHGAKGLEAPIVILADAADNPDRSRGSPLDIPDPADSRIESRSIPLPPLRKTEKFGPVAAAESRARAADRQEHWRLLYVAMTRAEEALFVAGALGPKEKMPAPDSWYARLAALFDDGVWQDDFLWGARCEHGSLGAVPLPAAAVVGDELPLMPPWLEQPIGPEPRPPRPLAPSALGEELSADPPYTAGAGDAARRRGVLMHRLLERLPDVEPSARKTAAAAWLARTAGDLAAPARDEMAASALAVLGNPDWAAVFSASALAEVPVAATVGGQVIAGTIDRLVIMPDRIQVIDFKTARRPPATLDEVPIAILRQMAAYAAALEAVYPERRIEAALLYTQVPILLAIPNALLAVHKQALAAAE